MAKYCNEKSRFVRKPYISKDHITQRKKNVSIYKYIDINTSIILIDNRLG